MFRRGLAGTFALALALLSGCGASVGSVAGQVTLDGKPVANATVSFIAPDGATVSAITDEAGKYRVENVPAGKVMVSVFQNAEEKGAPEVIKKRAAKLAEQGKVPPPPKNLLPAKYADTATSGLECEVKSGETPFDIALMKK